MSYRDKIREDAKRLNPIDDAFFVKMAEDLGFCEELLQVILEDKAIKVLENNYQYMIKNLQGKSCVLDLLCRLGSGHTVHVEVQKADDDDHQRRVRYNASVLTANITDPGKKYELVPDVISIFISRFDVFDKGLTTYHVERVIKETAEVLDNGTREIYVNSKVDDGSEIAGLMQVFANDSAYNDEKFPKTSARKRLFKTTDEGVNTMCDIIEKYQQEGRAEGRAEGKAEGKVEATTNIVINMLKEGLKCADIARMTQITVDRVMEIGKQASIL